MTPPDDIRIDNPASESGPENPKKPAEPERPGDRRRVGPESEVRGGPEAVDNATPDPA